jgi:hypothetical protein
MIQFEITQSPDLNVKTIFKFMGNSIYLGRKQGDLLIDDPSLKEIHAMVEVVAQDLLLHPQKEVDHFLINGKRATSVRKLRANDFVTIGSTVLKILNFEETIIETKKAILDKKLAQLVETNSSRLPIIDQLSKMSK